jgi:hypothetical protein
MKLPYVIRLERMSLTHLLLIVDTGKSVLPYLNNNGLLLM